MCLFIDVCVQKRVCVQRRVCFQGRVCVRNRVVPVGLLSVRLFYFLCSSEVLSVLMFFRVLVCSLVL